MKRQADGWTDKQACMYMCKRLTNTNRPVLHKPCGVQAKQIEMCRSGDVRLEAGCRDEDAERKTALYNEAMYSVSIEHLAIEKRVLR